MVRESTSHHPARQLYAKQSTSLTNTLRFSSRQISASCSTSYPLVKPRKEVKPEWMFTVCLCVRSFLHKRSVSSAKSQGDDM